MTSSKHNAFLGEGNQRRHNHLCYNTHAHSTQMNVSLSSMQKLPDIKCLTDITGAHHVSSSILQTQRDSFQKTMQRFRDQGETDSHCQVYKVLHGMWLKGRPSALSSSMSSETPTTVAYFFGGRVKTALCNFNLINSAIKADHTNTVHNQTLLCYHCDKISVSNKISDRVIASLKLIGLESNFLSF